MMNPVGMKARMLRGELYRFDDPELQADHARAQGLLDRYNSTRHADRDQRDRLLRELLGSVGDGVVIQPAFRCDYGTRISIGAACQLAPRVQLLTATHPIDPEPRRLGWELAKPIAIADNVWLGAGAIVCPGVRIGSDTVVGAGAVVTRDLPSGVVAFGSPAKVERRIGERGNVRRPDA